MSTPWKYGRRPSSVHMRWSRAFGAVRLDVTAARNACSFEQQVHRKTRKRQFACTMHSLNAKHTSNRYGCNTPLLLGKSHSRKCRSHHSEASIPVESRRTCRTTSYFQHGTRMPVKEESDVHLGESTCSTPAQRTHTPRSLSKIQPNDRKANSITAQRQIIPKQHLDSTIMLIPKHGSYKHSIEKILCSSHVVA